MRAHEFLSEKWITANKVDGLHVDIFVNPSRSEWLKFQKEMGYDGARACVGHNGDLYYWATDVLHDQVQEFADLRDKLVHASLHLPGRDNNVIWSEFEFFHAERSSDLYDEDVRDMARVIIDNPNITRALGPWKLIGQNDDLPHGQDHFEITHEWIEKNVKPAGSMPLHEAKVENITISKYLGSPEVKTWIDPTRSDIVQLTRRMALRGTCFDGRIYVWDAREATHRGMITALEERSGLEGDIRDTFLIYRNSNDCPNEWRGCSIDNTDGVYFCAMRTHPLFKRLLPSDRIDERVETHGGITFWKNPTTRQLKNITGNGRDTGFDLRGILCPQDGNVYVWDANSAIHYTGAKSLGYPPNEVFIFYVHSLENKAEHEEWRSSHTRRLGDGVAVMVEWPVIRQMLQFPRFVAISGREGDQITI